MNRRDILLALILVASIALNLWLSYHAFTVAD